MSVAAAVLLTISLHLSLRQTALTVILGGVAPLLASTWPTGRRFIPNPRTRHGSGGELQRTEFYLKKFSKSVEDQWGEEYKVRTFSDPTEGLRDIKASWSAADPPLAADWDEITKLASGSGPGSDDQQPLNGPRHPRGLSGLDEEDLREILEKVPTGWLMVLGAPGSGKTTLMIRTLRKIIRGARAATRYRCSCRSRRGTRVDSLRGGWRSDCPSIIRASAPP